MNEPTDSKKPHHAVSRKAPPAALCSIHNVKKLVVRAQEGDADAFVQLVEQYRQQMYKIAFCYLASGEDAADAIQDTILTAYEKLGDLKHPPYFKTWLIRILINRCKDYLNQRAREITLETVPDREVRDQVLERIICREMLGELDAKYRDVLILHYVEGFRAREIAEILDVKLGTVLTRLSRGRERMKEIYELNHTEGEVDYDERPGNQECI